MVCLNAEGPVCISGCAVGEQLDKDSIQLISLSSCSHRTSSTTHMLYTMCFKMLNKVKHLGPGCPGKPFWYDQNMACFAYVEAKSKLYDVEVNSVSFG